MNIAMEDEARFLQAVKEGDLSEVSNLLAANPRLANVRSKEGLPVVLASIYLGKREIAALLVQNGAKLDLFSAAAFGALDRVVEILDKWPDLVNAYAVDGFQALGLAAFFGHKEVVDQLVERGARVDSAAQNASKVTPLHSAAAAGHVQIAQTLLAHGANANAVQGGGFVALHAAAQNGQMEMVRLLLESGVDPGKRSDSGKTALDLAMENGHQEAASLIQEAFE